MDPLFKRQVYEIIRLIPEGRVTSYGAIAKAMGYSNHSRHVGNALRDYDEDSRRIVFVILQVESPQVAWKNLQKS